MKKIMAVFILFIGCIVGAAVWFSPLSQTGTAQKYENNAPVRELGVCYKDTDTVRVDLTGGEAELYAALDRLGARTVKTAESGGSLIVYAYSKRVAASVHYTSEGEAYNVMAALNGDRIAIGTPILEGGF